jgi:methylated-DNA-[protein]-cysteine S-methyltransferase
MLQTPLGEILLSFDDDVLRGLYFVGQKHQPPIDTQGARDDRHPLARRCAVHVERYFDGEAVDLDVPLSLSGTPFQGRVWEALRAIPRGRTESYASIARRVGAPAAVRAVGAAVGRNPVSIFVPCHRVVGSDGSLTGYAGGLPRKVHLLRLEGAPGAGQRVLPLAPQERPDLA